MSLNTQTENYVSRSLLKKTGIFPSKSLNNTTGISNPPKLLTLAIAKSATWTKTDLKLITRVKHMRAITM